MAYCTYGPLSIVQKLQVVSVSADTDFFPFIKLGDRLGQGLRGVPVTITTQQDHRGEFFVFRYPFALDHVYYHICALLGISRLVKVVGYMHC